MAPTAEEVARWMLGEVNATGALYQYDAAGRIQLLFGNEFIYTNSNGNLAIGRAVLREFRKISGDAIVWSRSDFAWRQRHDGDVPGSRQTD